MSGLREYQRRHRDVRRERVLRRHLMRGDLEGVVTAIRLSHRTYRTTALVDPPLKPPCEERAKSRDRVRSR